MKRLPVVVSIAAAVALIAPLFVGHSFVFHIATQALIWGLLAASWDVLGGYTRLISFGHAGFLAIGAYTAALVTLHWGFPLWAGMVMALLMCALVGLCVGFPALRLKGHYLALVSLGFGEMVQLVARNWEKLTGGSFGLHDFKGFPQMVQDPAMQGWVTYLVVVLVCALALVTMVGITRFTSAGNAFRAIREDEVLAQSLGINTTFFKLLAFIVSAAFSGLAGSLYAYQIQLVSPSLSTVGTSALIVGMVIFGGIGTIWGAFLGGVLLYLIMEALRFVGVVYNLVAVGLIMMMFVIFLPRGLAGITWGRGRIQRKDALGAATPAAAGEGVGD